MATRTATVDAQLPALTASFSAERTRPNLVTVDAQLPALEASVAADLLVQIEASLAGVLAPIEARLDVEQNDAPPAQFIMKQDSRFFGLFAILPGDRRIVYTVARDSQRLTAVNTGVIDRLDIIGDTMIPTRPIAASTTESVDTPIFILCERNVSSEYNTLRAYSKQVPAVLLGSQIVPHGTNAGSVYVNDNFVIVVGDGGELEVFSPDAQMDSLARINSGLSDPRVVEAFRATDLDFVGGTAWRVIVFEHTGARGYIYALWQLANSWILRIHDIFDATNVEGPTQLDGGYLLSSGERIQLWDSEGNLAADTRYRTLNINSFTDVQDAIVLNTDEEQDPDPLGNDTAFRPRHAAIDGSDATMTGHASGWITRLGRNRAELAGTLPALEASINADLQANIGASLAATLPEVTTDFDTTLIPSAPPTPFDADNTVASVDVMPDDSFMIGKHASALTIDGTAIAPVAIVTYPNGIDTVFAAAVATLGISATVMYRTCATSDGGYIIGGYQLSYSNPHNGGATTYGIAKLTSAGALDPTFSANIGTGFSALNARVYDIVEQGDGKVVIGYGTDAINYQGATAKVIRLNANGTADTTFNANVAAAGLVNGYVESLVITSGGKIRAGGNWNLPSPVDLFGLNADGTADTAYNTNLDDVGPATNSVVEDILLTTGDATVVGGNFTFANGVNVADRIMVLDVNGDLDTAANTAFGTGASSSVRMTERLSDGSYVVVGAFTNFNGVTVPRRIAKFNSSWVRDTAFDANVGEATENVAGRNIEAVAINSLDQILIVGFYTQFDTNADRSYITFLNADGTYI